MHEFAKNAVRAESLGEIRIGHMQRTADCAMFLAFALFAQVDQNNFVIVEQPLRLRGA